jgi:hypothetical protein
MEKSSFLGELIFFSAIAGGFAAPAKALFHHFMMIPGLFSSYYDKLTFFLIHGHYPIKGIWNWIFGEMGDIVIGAFFGIILGLWLRISRRKYHWWIGLVFGFGMWFVTLTFGNLTQVVTAAKVSPLGLFSHLLSMLIYGVNFVWAAHSWKPLKNRIQIPKTEHCR